MFVATLGWIALLLVLAGGLVESLGRYTDRLPPGADGGRLSIAGDADRPPSTLARLGALADERPAFVVAATGLAVLFLLYPFVDAVMRAAEFAPRFQYWDFGAYGKALDRWQAGESIYVKNAQGGYFGTYLYPPVFLLFVWPFYRVESVAAPVLWEITTVLFLWMSLQLVVEALGHRLRLWERGVFLWLLVGYHPLLFSVKQGQISALLAAFLSLSLYGLLRGRREGATASRYVSGVWTGFVGAIKAVYAPVGAHLLADRDRLLGAVLGGVAIFAVSVAVFGVDAHAGYLDVLLWGKGGTRRTPLLWLVPYFQPLYALGGFAFPIRVLASALVAALALGAAGEGVDREIFALGVAAMPVIAPQAFNFYFTALVPAALVVLAVELERDGRPLLVLAAVFLLHAHSFGLKLVVDHLPGVLPYKSVAIPSFGMTVLDFTVSLLQPGLWGCLLLGGLAGVRVARAATLPAAVSNLVERAPDSSAGD